MRLELVPPAAIHHATFMAAAREFREEGLPWWIGGDLVLAERDFAAFVAKKRGDAERRDDGFVPTTHRWALVEGEMVGRISVHHALNDALRMEGGHIGYDTVPSWRGRGVASEMLRQVLPLARELGLDEVLLTCNDDNAASIRVIEKNGGVLQATKVLGEGRPLKRHYTIDCRRVGS
ncbi:MAG: GNAT family N-acetyltransferase [Myxococcales bacterium]|nr:GNAT family N-acetyltransferase [Myxococcales bacterium]